MRQRFKIQSRAGQFSWLQVLALAISGVAYMLGSMVTAVIMLFLATILGVAAMMYRVREAQKITGQQKLMRGRPGRQVRR